MFSGIIEEIGVIKKIESLPKSKIFTISCKKVLEGCSIGDSLCINGVCLTVTKKSNDMFDVDIINETLKRTNLGSIKENSKVNLERSLMYNQRISGHLVQGHVDGLAKVCNINITNEWTEMELLIDSDFRKYCIQKGSIAIDGVSLTIAEMTSSGIKIALIPHTLKNTILSEYKIDQDINIELDMVGKYIESFSNYRA
tara:strand:- start:577 stop:1170 length:594 start_codon:yes stop_codon:yes gene_type:complete